MPGGQKVKGVCISASQGAGSQVPLPQIIRVSPFSARRLCGKCEVAWRLGYRERRIVG